MVVSVGEAAPRGQFVFPYTVLVERGVMSRARKGGKRAFRVYPPWSQPLVPAAILTQQWQAHYFLPFDEHTSPNRV